MRRDQLHEVIEQEGQYRLDRRCLPSTEQVEGCAADGWDNGLQGGDEVAQELVRIGIARVQGQPCYAAASVSSRAQPVGKQGGLAKSGRRCDQRQGALQPRLQPVEQARPRHQLGTGTGQVQLGG